MAISKKNGLTPCRQNSSQVCGGPLNSYKELSFKSTNNDRHTNSSIGLNVSSITKGHPFSLPQLFGPIYSDISTFLFLLI